MKKALLFSIAVCMSMLTLPVYAATSGDYEYTDNLDGTCTITGYLGPGGDVTIPDTLDGLTVTIIGDWSFEYKDTITSIIIPNNITSIGNGVFASCINLIYISIGNSVNSMGYNVFYDCPSLAAITVNPSNSAYSSADGVLFDKAQTILIQYPRAKIGNYTIPDSVITIDEYALLDCQGLTGVTMGGNVTTIGYQAFRGCSGMTNLILGNSIITIGNEAFQDCESLTGTLAFPGSVQTIGNYAFSACSSLGDVTIGNNVITIGDGVFSDCDSLTDIMVSASNPAYSSLDGVLFNKGQTVLVQYPCGKTGSYSIPNSVTTIGGSAFAFCYSLTSVTIPDSVTTIRNGAFFDCDGLSWFCFEGDAPTLDGTFVFSNTFAEVYYLPGATGWGPTYGGLLTCLTYSIADNGNGTCTITSYNGPGSDVTIPDMLASLVVTIIGDEAFNSCNGLTSVAIGSNVITIGYDVFFNCSELTDIVVGTANPAYSSLDGVLFNKTQTELIQYPGGKAGAYSIPDSVTTIGNRAFIDCQSLTSVVIGNSVISIGNWAFNNCDGLTSVLIGNGVTSIGDQVFTHCNSLTDILVDVANPAYSSLDGILFNKTYTEIIQCPSGKTGAYSIPDNINTIGNDAFSYCYNLTSITIPNSVTTIANGTFAYCDGLTSMVIPDSVISIGDWAFDGCEALTGTLILPDNLITIGDRAFRDCEGLTGTLTIPDNIITVGQAAFYKCIGLTSLILNNSITTINRETFADCDGLTSITVPDSVTSIESRAFSNCDILSCVIIGNNVTTIGDYAFSNCTELTDLYFKGDAPMLGTNVFYNVNPIFYYLPAYASTWPATYDGLTTAAWPTSIADMDTDGDVNLWDFATFAGAWGSVSGDPAYNPLCDISDPVGIIDTADLQTFANEWLITPCQ